MKCSKGQPSYPISELPLQFLQGWFFIVFELADALFELSPAIFKVLFRALAHTIQ